MATIVDDKHKLKHLGVVYNGDYAVGSREPKHRG